MPRKAQQLIEPIAASMDAVAATVFSGRRTVQAPSIALPPALKPNTRLKMDGLQFLAALPKDAIPPWPSWTRSTAVCSTSSSTATRVNSAASAALRSNRWRMRT